MHNAMSRVQLGTGSILLRRCCLVPRIALRVASSVDEALVKKQAQSRSADLMEEWTVSDGHPETLEAHAERHVVRSVIGRAVADLTVDEDGQRDAAQHQAARKQNNNEVFN